MNPSFQEDMSSQYPPLALLVKLGYTRNRIAPQAALRAQKAEAGADAGALMGKVWVGAIATESNKDFQA